MSFKTWWNGDSTAAPDPDIARREQYWFDHPFGFECQVTLVEPRESQAYVGGTMGGLFGALPVPFHGHFHDWGTFQVQGDRFVFLGRNTTRVVLFSQIIHTHYAPDGVQFHYGSDVIGFIGPVTQAVIGALSQTGYLPPARLR